MRVNANMLILLTSSRSTFDPTKIDQQPKKQHFVLVAAIFLIALKELIVKSLEIDKIKVSESFPRQNCFDKGTVRILALIPSFMISFTRSCLKL